MAVVMIRMRAQRQPRPQPQVVPPVNNPAFAEPEYAAVNYAEVGNAMPPRAPQYDTVHGFVRDQYAGLGPHSTYSYASADTEA